MTEDERLGLETVRDRGSNAAKIKRAIALLLADEGHGGPAKKDADILLVTGMSPSTLNRLRERCCEVGPLGALEHKQREKPPREIKITGEVEARITTLACSKPPAGHARWTLQLLADHLVEIGLLARTCLDRRIGSADQFRPEVTSYLSWKNADPKPISWQFTNRWLRR